MLTFTLIQNINLNVYMRSVWHILNKCFEINKVKCIHQRKNKNNSQPWVPKKET